MSKEDWVSNLPTKWQSEFKTAQLRGKLPIEDLLRFQILRCQATTMEEQEEAIILLKEMVPESWRDDEFRKAIDEATTTTEEWKYEFYCGTKLGTIEEPILNLDGTARSPILEEIPHTNYAKLFHAIMCLFDRRNLLITKREREFIPAGIIEETEDAEPEPTTE